MHQVVLSLQDSEGEHGGDGGTRMLLQPFPAGACFRRLDSERFPEQKAPPRLHGESADMSYGLSCSCSSMAPHADTLKSTTLSNLHLKNAN